MKKKSKEQLQYVAEQMALKKEWMKKELAKVEEEADAANKALNEKKDEEANNDPENGRLGKPATA